MNASALVVGARTGATAALQELAHAVGFMPVERYAGIASAERQARETSLVFFLCAEVPDIETLKRFNVALQSGIGWVSKNLGSKELRELIAGYTKINPELLAKMAPLGEPPRNVDLESIRKTVALMKAHELLAGDVNVEALLAPAVK